MDVEDAVGKGVEEGRAEEAHESREADERHAPRLELGHEDGFKGVARRIVAVVDRQGLDPGGASTLEAARVRAVRDHDGDLGTEPPVPNGVDERLEVPPAP